MQDSLRSIIITQADIYARFVMPAQAAIEQRTGCRIKSGMTALTA